MRLSLLCSAARPALLSLSLFSLGGCASLSAPFDQMKKGNAPETVLRLQNHEAAPTQAAGPAMPNLLPPQVTQGLQALAGFLPPGLTSLIPGMNGTPAAPAPSNIPRFEGAPILGSTQVFDQKLHDEILDIFGKESNWESTSETCMFPEVGVSMAQINQPPADVLISFGCHRIQTFNFAWPFGSKVGMKPDTEARIGDAVKKAFGG